MTSLTPISAVTTSAPSSPPGNQRLTPRPREQAIFVTDGRGRPRVLKVLAAIGAVAALAWLLALGTALTGLGRLPGIPLPGDGAPDAKAQGAHADRGPAAVLPATLAAQRGPRARGSSSDDRRGGDSRRRKDRSYRANRSIAGSRDGRRSNRRRSPVSAAVGGRESGRPVTPSVRRAPSRQGTRGGPPDPGAGSGSGAGPPAGGSSHGPPAHSNAGGVHRASGPPAGHGRPEAPGRSHTRADPPRRH